MKNLKELQAKKTNSNSTTAILIIIITILVIFVIALTLNINSLNKSLTEKKEQISRIEANSQEMQKTLNNKIQEEKEINNTLKNQTVNESKSNTAVENTANTVESTSKNTTASTTSDSLATYEIKELKSIYSVFTDDDTNEEKAKKIAKEIEKAANNKDYYFLAKATGDNADTFIQYGITNFKVDINSMQAYTEDREEYTFVTDYDWDKTKLKSRQDISLGNLLTITFKDGGRIDIELFGTGI